MPGLETDTCVEGTRRVVGSLIDDRGVVHTVGRSLLQLRSNENGTRERVSDRHTGIFEVGAMMRAAVVQDAGRSDNTGGSGIVEGVPDHDHGPCVDFEFREMMDQVRCLLASRVVPIALNQGHSVVQTATLHARRQVFLPPHRQDRLGPTASLHVVDRRERVDGEGTRSSAPP
jgi:hypothetical protein